MCLLSDRLGRKHSSCKDFRIQSGVARAEQPGSTAAAQSPSPLERCKMRNTSAHQQECHEALNTPKRTWRRWRLHVRMWTKRWCGQVDNRNRDWLRTRGPSRKYHPVKIQSLTINQMRERERGKICHSSNGLNRPGSRKPGARSQEFYSDIPCAWQRSKHLGSSSPTSPGTLAGSWIISGTASSQTGKPCSGFTNLLHNSRPKKFLQFQGFCLFACLFVLRFTRILYSINL